MDTFFTILSGILVAVAASFIILHFKKARFRVKAHPLKHWFLSDAFSKYLVVQITNIGYDKGEICDMSLELRKGSDRLIIPDMMHFKRTVAIDAKSTDTFNISCDSANVASHLENYSLIRAKVFTPTSKVYNSN